MAITPYDIARVASMAADSKKAQDIVVLDLTAKTDVCDYFVICSATSNPQADAIVDEIREKVRANCGVTAISTEGREGRNWILIDFGSVVAHVFKPETRDFYRLEKLWGDAPEVDMDLDGATDDGGAPKVVAGGEAAE
ncbi:MAG: ribosome silencing factor [Coriobacteriaceae bacterium]|uniref:ribosome silencing factor n=1 Tax=Tractidigestivibacter sp. TaxID=2847320 RepID=UPI002A91F8EA|nr:ribosome silencing factor [Tractidigestivibacter sp.]MCI6274505.1 ribosome silencing factor [Coriobacteriaceae bacterium]MCI6547046.1 ribosome silencing factor [Coriobacteriaceae bacterium]MCI6843189.1 ribosome silencing factor [Coriobacteriaceae bacterium]MDY5272378.1 ribosome silencing factor [Tractidigestivibacter sp.]